MSSSKIKKYSYFKHTKKMIIKNIHDLMFLDTISPIEPCHKCGNKVWLPTDHPLTWKCIFCGNQNHLHYGEFVQNIDILMSVRNNEFEYSPDGKKILPKRKTPVATIEKSKNRNKVKK